MGAIRETLKGLVRGTVLTRNRDDLTAGLQMAISGRHRIFFEENQSRILVVRVLHDKMDYGRHLESSEPAGDE
jgi:toxin ParE1/3/4